jgi:hypothetical protein
LAVNQLPGPLFGFFIVGGEDYNAVCYLAIVVSEVGVIAGHFVPRAEAYLGGRNSEERSQSLM